MNISDHPILSSVAIAFATFVAYCKYSHVTNKTGQVVNKPLDGPGSPPLYHISGDVMTRMIYKEIYVDRCYFKNGITLEGVKDPFIVDVGGNTGFFSRWCAETFPTGRVHVAEPIPLLQQCITSNIEKFKDRVTLHKCGVSNERASAVFTFFPTHSAGSSMFEGDLLGPMEKYPLMTRVTGLISDGQHVYTNMAWWFKGLAAALRVPVLNWFLLFTVVLPMALMKKVSDMTAGLKATKVKCELLTMDQMLFEDEGKIRFEDLKSIDLLKVDVEAAEWVVLMGISDKLWPKIRQVVVEVTDVVDTPGGEGRIAKMVKLFKEKGFTNVVVDVEDWESHKILDIKTIFASRK